MRNKGQEFLLLDLTGTVPPPSDGGEPDPFQVAVAAVRRQDHLYERTLAWRCAGEDTIGGVGPDAGVAGDVATVPEERRRQEIDDAYQQGKRMLLQSGRTGADPEQQRLLFVGMMVVVERITALSLTDQHLRPAVHVCRGAAGIAATLARWYPEVEVHRSIAVASACRLGDLHYLMGAGRDAQKCYLRALKKGKKLAERWLDAESLMQVGRSVRRLAELAAQDPGAGREVTVKLLEDAALWGALAADRGVEHPVAGLDVALTEWLLGTADPSRSAEQADRIVRRLGDAGPGLPPVAVAALAWARSAAD